MVLNQVVFTQPTYHVSLETTNKSFIDMYYYLINIGIPKERADFMLRLYDSDLIGVDPFDPKLTRTQKLKIAVECARNIWYFIRECVRVNTAAGKTRFELHRGNMALIYLFVRDYNIYIELPRQFGKTTASAVCYLWAFNFATRNSKTLFFHKEHKGSKDNLETLKNLRDNLPEYLQMRPESIGQKGQKIKVKNTAESISNAMNGNSIVTLASARSAQQADSIGRGKTCVFIHFDEYGFMPYNKIVYAAVYPAYSTASRAAASVGAHHGIIISTTPGDLTTQEGLSCYNTRNNATPWNDMYYAYSDQDLRELHASNKDSPFWRVIYSYTQLGRGADYLREMVIGMEKDWKKIRREVLLEWAQTSDNNPFGKEVLEKIAMYCKDPIRTMFFGKKNQYQFNVYEDLDPRYPPIIGVDVSGALYHDSSSIVIVDSKTTRVVADFNCNYIGADDLAELIYTLVTKFMPHAIVVIERNGGFGLAVIERLKKTSVKKNLYFEIKDKVFEESFNGVHISRKKARVKVYGTDSTKEVRARMIEILYERAELHKDKFISKIILNEMNTLEVDKRGKVQAISPNHDDQIFAYLHALRVWYDGEELAERYGIRKNSIRTDEDVEVEDGELEQLEVMKSIDLDTITRDQLADENDLTNVQGQLAYLAQGAKDKLQQNFYNEVYDRDEEQFRIFLASNEAARKAYSEKYHVDESSLLDVGSVKLPDDIFGDVYTDDDEEYIKQQQELHGNLYDMFMQL